MTETFDAALADVMALLPNEIYEAGRAALDRLAAAHAAEVKALQAINRRDVEMLNAWADRARQAEARAEAATALLRECLPYIEGHAQASHLTDGFKRRPNNAHDDLAARVAGMVGREWRCWLE